MHATAALGWTGDRRAIDPLIEALKDSDKFVRWEAANGLGALKDRRAVGPFVDALREHEDIEGNAITALRQITGLSFDYDRKLWLRWWEVTGGRGGNPTPSFDFRALYNL